VFQVRRSSLLLMDKELSGGAEPNAVARHGGRVYVLNVGETRPFLSRSMGGCPAAE
jgi:hypothetical protein